MNSNKQLPRSTPEKQGIPSKAILDFIDDLEKEENEIHGLMILRHGNVVSEGWWAPYRSELKHMLFSLSKSFTSTAVGLAVNEGLISVEDKVIAYFPKELPENISENLSVMKIKHLLSMSTGHDKDTTDHVVLQTEGNWVKGFLELEVEHEPGTYFVYNTAATYMLSAIVQKVTGHTLLNYLTPRIFKPLGIEGATFETCPKGINTGGFGLSIKTEDIAKFGQMYLEKGMYNGKALIPEAWVVEATKSHISNGSSKDSDWEQGYGYQFWRCRHNAYRGDGAFGQYCVVMPDQDMVVAINSGIDDMQPVLSLIWKHLLPQLGKGILTDNAEGYDELTEKLLSLKLPVSKECYLDNNTEMSTVENQICDKYYNLQENKFGFDQLSIRFEDSKFQISIVHSKGEYKISGGIEKRLEDKTDLLGTMSATSSYGYWSSTNTFIMKIQFIETPFCYTIKLYFKGNKIEISGNVNVSFGTKELPNLRGELY
ncbi:beta-lactamase family protein [Clostridium bowmanii]|uniref:serine hydrolase domain-containing protein n=1 Tax=Clostridium bowmanii TaxID=132925 RepID=UPI001C0E3129|nr:serine hydrolase [Clostridium bowmanii]MBU3191366.1 beta-lactamase family protein [Clostridium bowmanii]MCA1075789.1 beta-lactamase family protein [Clostridium bowmanii]